MIRSILCVALGGALGSVARFLISKIVQGTFITAFPIGTFFVNITGCLLIGLLYGIFERNQIIDTELKLILTVGFCGGFTTFSTFMNESLHLLRGGNILYCSLYLAASVVLGFLAVYLGTNIIKAL